MADDTEASGANLHLPVPRGDIRGIQELASSARSARETVNEGESLSDEELLQLYRQHREELHAFLSQNGDTFFEHMADSNGPGAVGLNNQGATCYLNSMLQLLFFTREIRENIQSWRFEEHNASGIPEQIQRLLCKMKYTKCPWVDTTNLTTAFKWNEDDVAQQQDSNELFTLLLDTLDVSMRSISDEYTPLQSVYEGVEASSLTCLSCRNSRWKSERFLSLSLPIPVSSEQASLPHNEKVVESAENDVKSSQEVSVEECLGGHFEEETFMAENALECEHCGQKQPTVRNVYIKDAPKILSVSFQRLIFNMKTLEQEKITSPIHLKRYLNISDYLLESEGNNGQYELFGLLVHIGGSHGGHYITYVNPKVGLDLERDGEHAWLELNDAVVYSLDREQQSVLFGEHTHSDNDSSAGRIADRQRQRRIENVKANVYSAFYRQVGNEDPSAAVGFPSALVKEVEENNGFCEKLRVARMVEKKLLEVSMFTWDCRYPQCGEYFDVHRLKQRRKTPLRTYTCFKRWCLRDFLQRISPLVGTSFTLRLFNSNSGELGMCLREIDGDTLLSEVFQESSEASVLLQPRIVDLIGYSLSKGKAAKRLTLLTEYSFREEDLFECANMVNSEFTSSTLPSCVLRALENAAATVIQIDDDGTTVKGTSILEEVCRNVPTRIQPGQVAAAYLSPPGDFLNIVSSLQRKRLPQPKALTEQFSVDSDDVPNYSVIIASVVSNQDSPTILNIFERLANMITIEFNSLGGQSENGVRYENCIQCHRSCTLVQLKQYMLPYFERPYQDVNKFHCKYNSNGAQIKAENKTIEELGLKDGSILHVCAGAPLQEGQHLIKILRFDPHAEKRKLSPYKKLAVNESDTVEVLKERLWRIKWSKELLQKSFRHLRLRALSGSVQGKVLCDGATLVKSIPALSDGIELAVEILEQPETPNVHDILITVAFMRRSKNGYSCLQVVPDLLLNKKITVDELLRLLEQRKREWLPGSFVEVENTEKGIEEKFQLAKCNKNVLANPTKPAIKRLRWCLPPLENTVFTFPLALRDQCALLVEDADLLGDEASTASTSKGSEYTNGIRAQSPKVAQLKHPAQHNTLRLG
eukprot:gb/GECG01000519.1/.p1 GENE.gb/GECG01000519.1/~~gb/GECG01000519.1/.p1  ORF type:complete len:1097 (+),score=134.15 gb/GECG01000519.1/:1-3291(+)